MLLTLQVEAANGKILSQNSGSDQVFLVHNRAYAEKDRLVLLIDTPGSYLVVQLEDSIRPAFLYMGEKRHAMEVPFGEKRICYSPKSFTGSIHVLTARIATCREIAAYKDLAENPLDCHENTCLFPHAVANVETRGESVFAARNVLDGYAVNTGHGPWPYQSWGVNRDPCAEMKIDFGREVLADKAVLTIRADYPHDSWWEHAALCFSDGSALDFSLAKTASPQTVEFSLRKARWVVLNNLIKANDESPFPALSRLQIWGTELWHDNVKGREANDV